MIYPRYISYRYSTLAPHEKILFNDHLNPLIFSLSACNQSGWDSLEESNTACFAAREKFIAQDMNEALRIIAPHDRSNRATIHATLTKAKIELAQLSNLEPGDLTNALVTTQSSPNIDFYFGTDGFYFNQGTSSASTTFKYKQHEVVFTCNFERNYLAWTARSIDWSARSI